MADPMDVDESAGMQREVLPIPTERRSPTGPPRAGALWSAFDAGNRRISPPVQPPPPINFPGQFSALPQGQLSPIMDFQPQTSVPRQTRKRERSKKPQELAQTNPQSPARADSQDVIQEQPQYPDPTEYQLAVQKVLQEPQESLPEKRQRVETDPIYHSTSTIYQQAIQANIPPPQNFVRGKPHRMLQRTFRYETPRNHRKSAPVDDLAKQHYNATMARFNRIYADELPAAESEVREENSQHLDPALATSHQAPPLTTEHHLPESQYPTQAWASESQYTALYPNQAIDFDPHYPHQQVVPIPNQNVYQDSYHSQHEYQNPYGQSTYSTNTTYPEQNFQHNQFGYPEWSSQSHFQSQQYRQMDQPYLQAPYSTPSLVRPDTGSGVSSRSGSSRDESQSFSGDDSRSDSHVPSSEADDDEDDLSDDSSDDGKAEAAPRKKGGVAGKRGPRPPAEMTGDIKTKMGIANELFLQGKHKEAIVKAGDVVKSNPEIYEAYTLLTICYTADGNHEKSLESQWASCHLRPKDSSLWLACAQRFHEVGNIDKEEQCYRSCVRSVPSCLEARIAKAMMIYKRGRHRAAISEFNKLLDRWSPNNIDVIRCLAESYCEVGHIEKARVLYQKTFTHLRDSPEEFDQIVDWDDVRAYADLCILAGKEFDAPLKELKSMSRWLLGRGSQKYFDDITATDCEWDCEDSRRVKLPEFDPKEFPISTYGDGLPLELRVKMGVLRLHLHDFEEANRHINPLISANDSEGSNIDEYPDLFTQVANTLMSVERYNEALDVYHQIMNVPDLRTPDLYLRVANCYKATEVLDEAETYFRATIVSDPSSIEARVELAKILEKDGKSEEALVMFNEIEELQKPVPEENKRLRRRYVKRALRDDFRPITFVPLITDSEVMKRVDNGRWPAEYDAYFATLGREHAGMRNGDASSVKTWSTAAKALTNYFEGNTNFFSHPRPEPASLPTTYQNISIRDWLDIFLEYALCLAKNKEPKQAYVVCSTAKKASVFSWSREDMFLIHVTWCTCAILVGDEEICMKVALEFLKDYRFTTDAYRMFAAIGRMCHSPISWYSSSASRDLVLQQVKSMDIALDVHRRDFEHRSSFATPDDDGTLIPKDSMNIALLLLYGHILYAGGSFKVALNFYFRAHALDPQNPMINLCISLAYANWAFNGRPGDNQQHTFFECLSFVNIYYESRKDSPEVAHRQEAHYNIARIYHMLGHANLAIPYYHLVFKEAEMLSAEEERTWREDIVVDAAYNLQTIYAAAGNEKLANLITQKWLNL